MQKGHLALHDHSIQILGVTQTDLYSRRPL
jgi:hypothetical protein